MKQILIGFIIAVIIIGSLFLIKNNQEEIPEEPIIQEPEQPKLIIETLQEGFGEGAKNGDKLQMHYTGTLEDGVKFDSSLDRGVPFEFVLGQGQVIQGWEQGILGMKAGEKRKLIIPGHLAYGEAGIPNRIPPNAVLIFEVELLKIN